MHDLQVNMRNTQTPLQSTFPLIYIFGVLIIIMALHIFGAIYILMSLQIISYGQKFQQCVHISKLKEKLKLVRS